MKKVCCNEGITYHVGIGFNRLVEYLISCGPPWTEVKQITLIELYLT